MLNHRITRTAFAMRPEGSLNRLPVEASRLPVSDPLRKTEKLTGLDLVSRQALIDLLTWLEHPCRKDLRRFLIHFDGQKPEDKAVLIHYADRFSEVIRAARCCPGWQQGNEYQQALANHWNSMETLVISGGLTTSQFGIQLAERIEDAFSGFAVIASPWAGQTALYGLAQAVAQRDPLLVLDFGATGVKGGIAQNFGNRIDHLFDIEVAPFKRDGLIYPAELVQLLKVIRQKQSETLPVAISLACYMESGIAFDYHSGIYNRLGAGQTDLFDLMNLEWLPMSGHGELKLIEHDSTAAALAFQFRTPAMMVTLGTGLGSAPCPLSPLPRRLR